jgi:hypothetical protein
MQFRINACLITLFSVLVSSAVCQGDLTIAVNYSGDAQYQPAFDNAASTWESLLLGYQNGHVVSRTSGSSYSVGQTINTVYIDAQVMTIDGPFGILGSAETTQSAVDQLGFRLATDGEMIFDVDDLARLATNGSLESVIMHEMAHVLGFGTLWVENGVYVTGSGEFTGANATEKWHTEFGQAGTPNVELAGGAGTADGHWDENDLFGLFPTGITDQFGRDMQFELMTGYLAENPFISEMTVASFFDIGFSGTAIPEPSSMAIAGMIALAVVRRRRV